jgi:tetratricopeptide (TPR) repeat protein
MTKILFAFLMLASTYVTAQVKSDTLTGKAAQEALNKLNIDNSVFIKTTRDQACKCIDDIKTGKKNKEKIAKEIKKCIDSEVSSYQLMQKLMGSMKATDTSKSRTITINTNKESDDYIKYYYEIERALRDSCESLKTLLTSNEKESKYSISKNEDAVAYYSIGQDAMKANNHEDAVKYFLKAVKKDSKFAFAWDNLGVSYRKLGKYTDAIDAYKKSLEIDPKNLTALQNLPLVYQYTKEYDKAVESYKELIALLPEDPEGYYGAGQALLNMKEYDKSLDYTCKAYNLYVKSGSPYRTDAEKMVQLLYNEFKRLDKVDSFYKILKDNNIKNTEK